MMRPIPALLLALVGLLAVAGCDTRDFLTAVLELRPAYAADATAPATGAAERVYVVYSDAEEATVRQIFGIAEPFPGVDYRGEAVAIVGRPLRTAEGRVDISRIELRGQREIYVRSRIVGRGGAAATRYGVAAVAVDRFGDGFTQVTGDFQ